MVSASNGLEKMLALAGAERELDEVSRTLVRAARAHGAPVTGAFQVSCSDESERENVESFHQNFVRELLPELKFASRSSFRTANLGGRYEVGSVGFAEDHFATEKSEADHKLLVVKINSHVSVAGVDGATVYGKMSRYQRESAYCGALHLLLSGRTDLPFLRDLVETFGEGDQDRIGYLCHEIGAHRRALVAGITSATLQAQRCREEARVHSQKSPTVYVIVAGVTLNRPSADTELVCSVEVVDRRSAFERVWLRGPGTDPRSYELDLTGRRLKLGVDDAS